MIKKILVAEDGRKFYIRNLNDDFHTQFGFITRAALAKAAAGDVLKTNTGKELFVFDPAFIDSYAKIKRAPQIIPRKDVAAIIAETGIGRGSIIVDAGTGSGALALFLANVAKKNRDFLIERRNTCTSVDYPDDRLGAIDSE